MKYKYYKYPKLKLYKIWSEVIKSVSVVGFCPERVTLCCVNSVLSGT